MGILWCPRMGARLSCSSVTAAAVMLQWWNKSQQPPGYPVQLSCLPHRGSCPHPASLYGSFSYTVTLKIWAMNLKFKEAPYPFFFSAHLHKNRVCLQALHLEDFTLRL